MGSPEIKLEIIKYDFSKLKENIENIEKEIQNPNHTSYLCVKNKGSDRFITVIGFWGMVSEVIGGWLGGVNGTSKALIDTTFTEILTLNKENLQKNDSLYKSIYKVAVQTHLIQESKDEKLQFVATNVTKIATFLNELTISVKTNLSQKKIEQFKVPQTSKKLETNESSPEQADIDERKESASNKKAPGPEEIKTQEPHKVETQVTDFAEQAEDIDKRKESASNKKAPGPEEIKTQEPHEKHAKQDHEAEVVDLEMAKNPEINANLAKITKTIEGVNDRELDIDDERKNILEQESHEIGTHTDLRATEAISPEEANSPNEKIRDSEEVASHKPHEKHATQDHEAEVVDLEMAKNPEINANLAKITKTIEGVNDRELDIDDERKNILEQESHEIGTHTDLRATEAISPEEANSPNEKIRDSEEVASHKPHEKHATQDHEAEVVDLEMAKNPEVNANLAEKTKTVEEADDRELDIDGEQEKILELESHEIGTQATDLRAAEASSLEEANIPKDSEELTSHKPHEKYATQDNETEVLDLEIAKIPKVNANLVEKTNTVEEADDRELDIDDEQENIFELKSHGVGTQVTDLRAAEASSLEKANIPKDSEELTSHKPHEKHATQDSETEVLDLKMAKNPEVNTNFTKKTNTVEEAGDLELDIDDKQENIFELVKKETSDEGIYGSLKMMGWGLVAMGVIMATRYFFSNVSMSEINDANNTQNSLSSGNKHSIAYLNPTKSTNLNLGMKKEKLEGFARDFHSNNLTVTESRFFEIQKQMFHEKKLQISNELDHYGTNFKGINLIQFLNTASNAIKVNHELNRVEDLLAKIIHHDHEFPLKTIYSAGSTIQENTPDYLSVASELFAMGKGEKIVNEALQKLSLKKIDLNIIGSIQDNQEINQSIASMHIITAAIEHKICLNEINDRLSIINKEINDKINKYINFESDPSYFLESIDYRLVEKLNSELQNDKTLPVKPFEKLFYNYKTSRTSEKSKEMHKEILNTIEIGNDLEFVDKEFSRILIESVSEITSSHPLSSNTETIEILYKLIEKNSAKQTIKSMIEYADLENSPFSKILKDVIKKKPSCILDFFKDELIINKKIKTQWKANYHDLIDFSNTYFIAPLNFKQLLTLEKFISKEYTEGNLPAEALENSLNDLLELGSPMTTFSLCNLQKIVDQLPASHSQSAISNKIKDKISGDKPGEMLFTYLSAENNGMLTQTHQSLLQSRQNLLELIQEGNNLDQIDQALTHLLVDENPAIKTFYDNYFQDLLNTLIAKGSGKQAISKAIDNLFDETCHFNDLSVQIIKQAIASGNAEIGDSIDLSLARQMEDRIFLKKNNARLEESKENLYLLKNDKVLLDIAEDLFKKYPNSRYFIDVVLHTYKKLDNSIDFEGEKPIEIQIIITGARNLSVELKEHIVTALERSFSGIAARNLVFPDLNKIFNALGKDQRILESIEMRPDLGLFNEKAKNEFKLIYLTAEKPLPPGLSS